MFVYVGCISIGSDARGSCGVFRTCPACGDSHVLRGGSDGSGTVAADDHTGVLQASHVAVVGVSGAQYTASQATSDLALCTNSNLHESSRL